MQNRINCLEIAATRKIVNDHVISYLTQCRIPKHLINPRLVVLALEESYRPQQVFWRALTRTTVLRALETYAHGFRNSLTFLERNAYWVLVDRIDFLLAMRASDELNAEILLSVAESQRPTTPTAAIEFLVCALIARRKYDEAKWLLTDGETAAAAALELVEAQLAAREGRCYETVFGKEATHERYGFTIALPFADDEFQYDEDVDDEEYDA